MVYPRVHRILRRIRLVIERHDSPLADGELLQQFAEHHDESAFRQLMNRHGSLVWGVCQRVLGQSADADDAFQATFLVLARKAGAVANRESLRSWLHGVAYRVARNAVRAKAVRRQREESVPVRQASDGVDELSWKEVRQVLDEELLRLPEKYRLPLLCCYLDGKTQDEAARELGWSVGVVRGRLDRGRERLRWRLTQRGITLASALAGTLAAQSLAQATVPARLLIPTTHAASLYAVRTATDVVSAPVAALAEGVLRSMSLTKIKLTATLTLSLCVLAASAGVIVRQVTAAREQPVAAEQEPPVQVAEAKAKPAELEQKVDVHGDPLPAGAIGRFGTTRLRAKRIAPLFFDNNDGVIITGGEAHVVQFWHPKTGKLVRSIDTQQDHVGQFALSSDRKTLAWRGADRVVYLMDTGTEKVIGRLANPKDQKAISLSSANVFSPDSRLLATKDHAQKIAVWDVAGRKQLWQWDNIGSWCAGDNLAFSPDSKRIAVSSDVGEIILLEAATGKRVRQFGSLSPHVSSVQISPDAKVVAAADWEGTIRVWDLESGKLRHELKGPKHGVYALAFAPDSQTLAAGGADHSLHLIDVATGKVRRIQGNKMYTYSLLFSRDGKTLAAGGYFANTIRLWDVATGKEVVPLRGHNACLLVTVFSPDGKLLASAGQDEVIRIWDVGTKKEVRQLHGCEKWVEDLAFSPDGKLLASASRDRVVRVWEVETGHVLRSFPNLQEAFNAVAFAPNGKFLASSGGKQAYVWDPISGKEIHKLEGHPVEPMCLAFSRDSRTLAAGGNDGSNKGYVILWDLSRPGSYRQLNVPDLCRSLAFSPNGKLLAIGEDRALDLWELATMKQCCCIPKGEAGVSQTAFSPDGRLLATSGYDNHVVALWDALSGKPRHILKGHQDGVRSVAFSPDGQTLITASYDTTALLWKVEAVDRTPRRADWKAQDLETFWSQLGGDDATQAYTAIGSLAATPGQSVAFLRKQIPRPQPEPDAKRIDQLIADLDGDDFATREKARRELERLGESVAARIRKELEGQISSLEQRRRLDRLLKTVTTLTPEQLRWLRAIQALEFIDTAEAKALLETLTREAPSPRGRQDARVTLSRLEKRSH
jgi:RNA polymerase sigma factor (sigma-70 family)